MDIGLAREIYGCAWYIDPTTFMQYTKMLEAIHNGIEITSSEKKNTFGIYSEDLTYDAREIANKKETPKGSIAVYNFNSVITKGGGMSHYGTKDIAKQFELMENDSNVIGHIFKIESGGGSVNAIKYIRDVSKKANRKKPLVTYAEDIMASAAMYIGSDADYIIANSEDADIGSIGTMMQMSGYPHGEIDQQGRRHVRIYATRSINKNKEYEDAINNGSYEVIQKETLDPLNEKFISDMMANRPSITEAQKTGAIFRADQCIGTLVDGIGTMSMAIAKVRELASSRNNNVNSKQSNKVVNKSKSSKMEITTEEFDAKIKAAKEEGKKEGIQLGKQEGIEEGKKAEQARIQSWNVWQGIDPEAVKAGIDSGKEIDTVTQNEFVLKASQKTKIDEHKDDNPEDVDTPEETKTAEQIFAENEQKKIDKFIG